MLYAFYVKVLVVEDKKENNNQSLNSKPVFQKVESEPQDISSQPQVTQPPETQPKVEDKQPVEVKPKKELLIPILLILLLIVFGITAYLGYQYYQSTKQLDTTTNEIQPSSLPTDESTSIPDPTTDWKIFSNTKYGYQFKYPDNWEVNRGPGESSDEELGKTRNIHIYSGRSTELSKPSDIGLSFSIDTNQLHQKGDEKLCNTLEDCITKSTGHFPKELERTEESFQGNKAIRIIFRRDTSLYYQVFSYLFVIIGDDFYDFEMIVQNGDFKDHKDLFDQILSTFKFLDDNENTKTYSHDSLPGFAFDYQTGLILKTKQFGLSDPEGFISTYFPTCHDRCMGVRLSNEHNVSLNLIFDVAFDDVGMKCSDNVDFTEVGNGWYRIKDSSGYFYSRNIELNKTLGQGNFIPLGTIKDEWSAIENTKYKICINGNGNFLKQYSFVEKGEDNDGVPIMMELPNIIGTPDDTFLKEIDNAVTSIKGI